MSDDKRLMNQPRKDTPIENIIAHYMDERSVTLTEHEEELKERLKSAFMMLVDEDSVLSPITKLMDLYKVTRATAYNYLNQSQIIFGQAQKLDKEAMRVVQIERKRKMIARAKKEGNLEVEARLERDIDKLLDFDKDPEKYNPEKFKAMKFEFSVDNHTKKLLEKMYGKGTVDLNSVEAEDVGFEYVKDEEE